MKPLVTKQDSPAAPKNTPAQNILGELDIYLMTQGNHLRLADKLGAHPGKVDGVEGVSFAVWAPNAGGVAVVGDFNNWSRETHKMRLRPEAGVWELFIPHVRIGALYKYAVTAADGRHLPEKSDPFGFAFELRPHTASIVSDLTKYQWRDKKWMAGRGKVHQHDQPMTIYEVHLGSWRRHYEGNRFYTYADMIRELVPYVRDMGFTHVEFMPVHEYPFDGSWGYQPIGLFAPTCRYGTHDDFRALVDAFHEAGIGVIIDFVTAHFPADGHGLLEFDGTHLYEHADWRQGFHPDWNTYIFNFGRNEVSNYLLSAALFWAEQYHIDGLRFDAVASMLYLDYSRKQGEWIPNHYGGRENLEAIGFLRKLNEVFYGTFPDTVTIAEESTAWPMVSKPTYVGGLGFGYKWNMGWMHDTLNYISKDPIYRSYDHHNLTFGLLYQFTENFVLPISHDEVVHGKGSLYNRMPGDRWQKFANLRAYLAFMWGHPGKKLLFMGCEFGQESEWNFDIGLEWGAMGDPFHANLQKMVGDLNHLLRAHPALYERDNESDGFEWLEANDHNNSVLAFMRLSKDGKEKILVVCNFTPVVRYGYRLGLPFAAKIKEIFNSDSQHYSGSDVGNIGGEIWTEKYPSQAREDSVVITLPPLATIYFKVEKI